MSTKVYNGVRFVPTDMLELHKLFMKWRVRVKELTIAAQAEFLRQHTIVKIDLASAKGETIESPLSNAFSYMMEQQEEVKKTQRRNPLVDFEFECVVMPYRGRLYGIVFCEQSKWVEEFKAQKWVEDFSYWNNTDREEGVSRDEWRARERVWNNITKNDPSPAQNGFTADCTAQYARAKCDDILPLVGSLEQRALICAKEIVTAAYVDEIRPQVDPDAAPSYGWLWRALGYTKTDEGKAKTEAEAERIKPLLHPEITKTILLGWDPAQYQRNDV